MAQGGIVSYRPLSSPTHARQLNGICSCYRLVNDFLCRLWCVYNGDESARIALPLSGQRPTWKRALDTEVSFFFTFICICFPVDAVFTFSFICFLIVIRRGGCLSWQWKGGGKIQYIFPPLQPCTGASFISFKPPRTLVSRPHNFALKQNGTFLALQNARQTVQETHSLHFLISKAARREM